MTGRASSQPVRPSRAGASARAGAYQGVRRLARQSRDRGAQVADPATRKRRAETSSPVAGNSSNAWNVNFNNGNTNNNDVGNTNQVRCVR